MKETKSQLLKQKTKKSLFRTIFSRSFVFCIIIILQILFYLFLLSSAISSGLIKYTITAIITIITAFIIINKNENPMYIISWLFLILGFPVLGICIYIFINIQPQVKNLNKKYQHEFKKTKTFLKQDALIQDKLKQQDKHIYNLSNYLYDYSGSVMGNNSVARYFSCGEDMYEELKRDLSQAKKFIFMEYFIIQNGIMWDSILEILENKAKEGVEIRLIYDGTCSFSRLPVKYPDFLKSKGIKCKIFSPIKPFLTSYQNNRDHRKIVVIDNNISYTGGVNLSDEYIGEYEPFGKWKDAGIKIKGDATKNFTLLFLQVWNMLSKDNDNFNNYFYENKSISNGFVTAYGDAPFDDERVGENIYISMINHAENYVHIMTPYLIPSYEMIQALTFSAKKGVDVKIIMPHIPDKKYAFWVAHTYYPFLIKNGVKIYEWKPGFIHSKLFIVDNLESAVGSINLDFRSLFLHMECSTYLYDNSEILNIEKDYEKTLNDCIPISLEYLKSLPWYQKAIGQILKLIAPLL